MISKEYEVTSIGQVLFEGKDIVAKGGQYPTVCIKGKQYYVHRLVAEKFLDNPDNLREVNHIDGRKHNTKHGWDSGLLKPDGLVKNRRKLSPEQVIEIRSRYEPRCKTNGTRALSREFNVSQAQISFIVNNRERVKHEHI